MKKRMFLSTILMTLVLLVAVTTATFAWYSASGTGVALAEPEKSSIKTKTEGLDGLSIAADWSYQLQGTGEALNSIGEMALTGNDGKAYVVNSANTLVEVNSSSKFYKVTVTLTISSDAATDYAGVPVTFQVTADKPRIRLAKTTWNTASAVEQTYTVAKGQTTLGTLEFYVSVMGAAGDVAPEAGTTVTPETAGDISGTITLSIK